MSSQFSIFHNSQLFPIHNLHIQFKHPKHFKTWKPSKILLISKFVPWHNYQESLLKMPCIISWNDTQKTFNHAKSLRERVSVREKKDRKFLSCMILFCIMHHVRESSALNRLCIREKRKVFLYQLDRTLCLCLSCDKIRCEYLKSYKLKDRDFIKPRLLFFREKWGSRAGINDDNKLRERQCLNKKSFSSFFFRFAFLMNHYLRLSKASFFRFSLLNEKLWCCRGQINLNIDSTILKGKSFWPKFFRIFWWKFWRFVTFWGLGRVLRKFQWTF
jgi:hypothetical protein